jgi:hypothetical protein
MEAGQLQCSPVLVVRMVNWRKKRKKKEKKEVEEEEGNNPRLLPSALRPPPSAALCLPPSKPNTFTFALGMFDN